MRKFIPPLLTELQETIMIPFVLSNILLISEKLSIQEFELTVFPSLVPIFKIQEPIQILQIFLHKMSVLLTKSPQSQLEEHVLPMVYRALDPQSAPAITQLALQQLPDLGDQIDYSILKNDIIPRIQAQVVVAQSADTKINALVCLGKMLPVYDKWLFAQLLEFLTKMPTENLSGGVRVTSLLPPSTSMTHR